MKREEEEKETKIWERRGKEGDVERRMKEEEKET